MVEIAHQRRTGGAADHAFGRAAHVDVDQIGAAVLGKPRRLGHGFRRAQPAICTAWGENAVALRAQKPPRGPPLAEFVAGDHFRKGQRRAEIPRQPAHGEIGDAGHGREKGRRRQMQIADRKSAEQRGAAQALCRGACLFDEQNRSCTAF